MFRIFYGKGNKVYEAEIEENDYRRKIKEVLEGRSGLVPKVRVMEEVILFGKRVKRKEFRTVERALRAFDGVGISNELYDFLEVHEDADWMCFGSFSEEEADLSAWEV